MEKEVKDFARDDRSSSEDEQVKQSLKSSSNDEEKQMIGE